MHPCEQLVYQYKVTVTGVPFEGGQKKEKFVKIQHIQYVQNGFAQSSTSSNAPTLIIQAYTCKDFR